MLSLAAFDHQYSDLPPQYDYVVQAHSCKEQQLAGAYIRYSDCICCF